MKKPVVVKILGALIILSGLIGIGINVNFLLNPFVSFDPEWEPYVLILWGILCVLSGIVIAFLDREKSMLAVNIVLMSSLGIFVLSKFFDMNGKSAVLQLAILGICTINKDFRFYLEWTKADK